MPLLDHICREIILPLGKANFAFFFQKILGFDFADYPMNWHLFEWFDFAMDKTLRFICIECSRDFAKSTVWARAFPMWRSAYNPGELGVILAGDGRLAEQDLRVVKNWCHGTRSNAYLRWLYSSEKWSTSEVIFANRAHIFTGGYGSTPRGLSDLHRPMWVVNDDIYGDSNKMSIEAIEDFFFRSVRPMVDPKRGRIILIGTRKSVKDLFAKLTKTKRWLHRVYKSYNPLTKVALWPGRYTYKELMAIREEYKNTEKGILGFLQEYQCEPVNPFGEQLKKQWLKYFRMNQGEIEHWDPVEHKFNRVGIRVSDLIIYQGCDPTRGKKDSKRADYFAVATLGWHNGTKTAYLIDIVRYKLTLPDQVKKIEFLYNKWKSTIVFVEKNLYEEIGQWLRELTTVPFHGVHSSRDKVANIQQLGGHFEAGRIYILHSQEEFRIEYLSFDGSDKGYKDDQLDALHLAMLAVPSRQLVMPVTR